MAVFDHESLDADGTVKTLTAAVYAPAGKHAASAVIYVDGTADDILRWDIGQDPVSGGAGMETKVAAGTRDSYIELEGDEIAGFRFTNEGAPVGTITLRVRYKFWE